MPEGIGRNSTKIAPARRGRARSRGWGSCPGRHPGCRSPRDANTTPNARTGARPSTPHSTPVQYPGCIDEEQPCVALLTGAAWTLELVPMRESWP